MSFKFRGKINNFRESCKITYKPISFLKSIGSLHHSSLSLFEYLRYGNTGCVVFKPGGGTKSERFLPKNQHA